MVCVQARPTHNGSLHKVQRPTESSHEPKHEIPLVKLEQVGGAKRQGALLIGGSELGKILVGGEGEESDQVKLGEWFKGERLELEKKSLITPPQLKIVEPKL
ncbi:hypothetical protein RRG08_044175 [Elysia crispata]|uniref:Uncharacterized protein n=1 Tax=Elysia crispata TaxID=231223 RepID=A0AAE0XWN7_9GAST|nr:hypothetical protein RRG08_044175 [Elysia crispata]